MTLLQLLAVVDRDLKGRWRIVDDPQPMTGDRIGKEFDEQINFTQEQP